MAAKKWTLFWDMHSGGGLKESPYDKIYIEAPEEEAKRIFIDRFGHDPEDVACQCCGQNYSIRESDNFEQASGFHRNCDYDKKAAKYIEKPDTSYGRKPNLISVDDYKKQKNVLVISADQI